ncbi:hypothetical protein BU16DRAFT_597003 [Lophium mytilinum]|uniref:Uncharacterized protein n=1 Tax=Lophium mytilinum TaxID=390894 RepID=A0A6A6QBW8_9PEZI|nr:hypothetical protein BU16DRAFT_597003 [Lophium mytilinum]
MLSAHLTLPTLLSLLSHLPPTLSLPKSASLTPLSPNTLTLHNACPYPLLLSSISQTLSLTPLTIPSGRTHTEPLRTSCAGCGVSLKLAHPAAPAAVTQFEYSITGGRVWYDISLIDCVKGGDASQCPGHEAGLKIHGDGGDVMRCAPGSYCAAEAYYVPVPGAVQPVGSAVAGGDLRVEICSG